MSVSVSQFIYIKTKEVADKLERSTSDVVEDALTRYLEQLNVITERVHSS
jgi:predicted transcriptional regulator